MPDQVPSNAAAAPLASDEAEILMASVTDLAFQCGEWDSENDEPYEKVHDALKAAEAELRAFIVRLEGNQK